MTKQYHCTDTLPTIQYQYPTIQNQNKSNNYHPQDNQTMTKS
jgi:hypothetical protein